MISASTSDGLDEIGEAIIVDIPLAMGGGVEVNAVDDALQERVFLGDGPHMGGDAFAYFICELADNRPDRFLRGFRQQR
jgi:hypothetical protein